MRRTEKCRNATTEAGKTTDADLGENRLASTGGLFLLAAIIAVLSPANPQVDPAMLKSLCETIAKEDADNDGITALGTPWNLNDLTTDASLEYSIEKFKTTDLPRAGAVCEKLFARS